MKREKLYKAKTIANGHYAPDSNSKSCLAVSFLRYKLEMGMRAVFIQQQLRKSNSWQLWKKRKTRSTLAMTTIQNVPPPISFNIVQKGDFCWRTSAALFVKSVCQLVTVGEHINPKMQHLKIIHTSFFMQFYSNGNFLILLNEDFTSQLT